MDFVVFLMAIIFAYLLGSVPFAYVLVKLMTGKDIRTIGSGNAGATNAGRVLGKFGFATVLILDMLKGFLPVKFASVFYGAGEGGIIDGWQTIFVAIAVILGHTYTIFLKFKGGKGVATTAGVALALIPLPSMIALVVFLAIFLWKRMVSLGSMVASVVLFLATLIFGHWILMKALTLIIAVFIIYKHKDNIKRILNGTESTFKKKNEPDNKPEENNPS